MIYPMQAYTTNKSQPKLHHLCWCLNPVHFSVFLCNTCRRTWSCNYYMLCKHKIISVYSPWYNLFSSWILWSLCGLSVVCLLDFTAACILSLILFNVLSLYCVLLIVPYMAISNRILTSFWSCSWKDVEGLLHIH